MSKLYSAIVLLLSISLVQSKPLVDNDAIVFRDSDEDVSNNSSLLYGDHFQGDIILNSEQEDIFLNKSGKLAMGDRTGLIHEAWRWPKVADGNVNVPIEISSSFGNKLRVDSYELIYYTCGFKGARDKEKLLMLL